MAGYCDFRGHRRRKHAAAPPLLLSLCLLITLGLGVSPDTVAAQNGGAPTGERSAPALPFAGDVSLGSGGPRVQVRVDTDAGDTRIQVTAGGRSAEVRFPGERVSATAEPVADGAAVVRAQGGPGPVAALVVLRRGRPEIVWSGRLYLHGDPGEQTADVLEVADRTGDGRADVVVGQQRQGVGLCGQPMAVLFPRALDPRSLQLRPVVLRRLPAEGEEHAIAAVTASPGPTGAPLVRALTAVGATSSAMAGEDAGLLEPPRALIDGDTATAWTEGRGGHGEGELAALRFGGGMPIRALALVAPAAGRAPSTVVLSGDTGPRFRVTLPALAPGARAWVVPPEPVSWSCVAVVLADAGGEAASRTGMAELEVYTELDFGGGIDALVAELVRDEPGGDRATELLSRLGEPAVQALASAWERLGPRGRERAVRVALGPARTGNEAALALLERAASDEAEGVRAAALEALGQSGAPGRARIVRVAALGGSVGDDAARRLAEADGQFDPSPLLAAANAEGGSERPWLRAAIARALAIGRSEDVTAVENWEAQAPVGARASVALGLAQDEATRGLALLMAARARGAATEFVDRWRLAAAIAAIDTGTGEEPTFAAHPEQRDAIDAWLGELVRGADEWMLREIALRAIGERDREVARAALEDRYPRVRVAAVDVLASSDDDVARLREALRGDAWPLVRTAALDAIADREAEREAVIAALDDDAQMVRRRAIDHLTRLADRSAAEAVAARLADANEWPIVIDSALLYVETLCVAEAGPAVLDVIRRGIRPNAWEPHVEAAERALRVAQRLGGETATEARTIAARGGERMQSALQQPPPEACGR